MSLQHIVIRQEQYVAGIRQKPEVGVFTQTRAGRRPVPWGRVAPGETVWMKWSGGPIVARAKVQGFRQIEDCTAEQLRSADGVANGKAEKAVLLALAESELHRP